MYKRLLCTRMRWACKNCQAPQGVVQAPICILPAPSVLARAWCSGTVQNQDTVTVPWPTCLMWDLQEGAIWFFLQYSWAWGPANILGSQSWNARSFNKIAGTRRKGTASAQKACYEKHSSLSRKLAVFFTEISQAGNFWVKHYCCFYLESLVIRKEECLLRIGTELPLWKNFWLT